MLALRATAHYSRAIHATAELLTKLRLGFAFVGNVARAAWLGGEVERGSLEVLAVMTPEQKNQVAMMANNRGFLVDRDAIEQSIELDLIPLGFEDIRVHVLVASNALYGRMVANARVVDEVSVVAPEDLALLMTVADDADREKLFRLPDFDRNAFNARLRSIGLAERVAAE